MALPQVVVVLMLVHWRQPVHALAIVGLLLVQLILMDHFMQDPRKRALLYSGFGVPLFVAGMMVSAFALRSAGALP
jgi:chlorophyll synthase